jgi:SAM-dependent methyltransferase
MSNDSSWIETMPEIYDRCLGPALFMPYASHVAELVAARAPQRVLELAAGTGILTMELARLLPNARIIASDLNPAMVSWAAHRVPNVDWRQADAPAEVSRPHSAWLHRSGQDQIGRPSWRVEGDITALVVSARKP